MEMKKGKDGANFEELMLLVKELQDEVRKSRLELEAMAKEGMIAAKQTLNRKEAAAYMGVSVSAMNWYCKNRVITYYIAGGMSYFDKSELDSFMHTTRVGKSDEMRQLAEKRFRELRKRQEEPRSFLAANG